MYNNENHEIEFEKFKQQARLFNLTEEELNKNKKNCEKMTIVRANKKMPMNGMKKPKGIKEWL
jgi:hypothetical protein